MNKKAIYGFLMAAVLWILALPVACAGDAAPEAACRIGPADLAAEQSAGMKQFVLPASLRVIDDEAFLGTGAEYVRIPEMVVRIGDQAFAENHSLKELFISQNEIEIGESVFSGNTVNITGFADSYSRIWAMKNGYRFVLRPAFRTAELQSLPGIIHPGTGLKGAGLLKQKGLAPINEKDARTGRPDGELKTSPYSGRISIYIRSRYFP